jgi:transcriptional regulator with XRE-family HTH domain
MPVEIEAGKLGRQIDSRGVVKEFTPEFFQEVVGSYNPENFKAPAIISHDTKGIPDDKLHANQELCYGVASGLKVVGDRLKVTFDKISPKIKEHFENGELLSVSPSFYPPTHHANPTPGKWSLRHLSFLGASPPAIKGLSAPTFSETGYNPAEDTLEFSFPVGLSSSSPEDPLDFSYGLAINQSLFGNLRDWLIEKHGKEETEKILPASAIAELIMADRNDGDQKERLMRQLDELGDKVRALEAQIAREPPVNIRSAIPIYKEPSTIDFSDMNTGQKIAKLAAEKEVSEADLAKSAGITEETLGQIMDGEIEKPTKKQLKGFAQALGVPIEMLMNNSKTTESKTTDMSEEQHDYAAELAEERRARKLLEFQVQNEQRKAEQERRDRKFEKITHFCEGLVRDGQLAAQQVGDRLLEFGEGEETQQSLPQFLMSLDEEQLSFMENFLSTQPKVIEYGEFAPDNTDFSQAGSVDFSAVPGADISEESRSEYEEILSYCEQNGLDPNDDAAFTQAAKALFK